MHTFEEKKFVYILNLNSLKIINSKFTNEICNKTKILDSDKNFLCKS